MRCNLKMPCDVTAERSTKRYGEYACLSSIGRLEQNDTARLDEAEAWDWADPELWRIVNGWQITSFDSLLNILTMKAEKGVEEIQILQSPRFMMLAGG